MRSFLHNIDSCRAVLELMASTSALDGTVYNVATDEEVSIIDLVKLIADKLNIAEPIISLRGIALLIRNVGYWILIKFANVQTGNL